MLSNISWAWLERVKGRAGRWKERKIKEAYFSRPKMKALSLILWLVSSQYWLTLENRLCKTRVEGPKTERISVNHFLHSHPYNNHLHHSSHTELCGCLHHTPGLVFALSDDQVQYIRFQSIMQDLTNGRTEVLKNKVTHVWTYRAIAQFGLYKRAKVNQKVLSMFLLPLARH